jgi:hypothetical protein
MSGRLFFWSFALLLLLSPLSPASAQSSFSSGDSYGQHLACSTDGATIVLLSAKDSLYVTMVASDEKGAFTFPGFLQELCGVCRFLGTRAC